MTTFTSVCSATLFSCDLYLEKKKEETLQTAKINKKKKNFMIALRDKSNESNVSYLDNLDRWTHNIMRWLSEFLCS